MYLLGYDIGSSSIKTTLLDAESGKIILSSFSPQNEMGIIALKPGWAEQDPELWWQHLKISTREILTKTKIDVKKIKAIGISYQMHGLVLIDKHHRVLRNSIIWCDSRAIKIGSKAFDDLGKRFCLEYFLNSPGNFTASKLRWVKDQEPNVFSQIYKMMLPGDYIAMRLTGLVNTTNEGLSEAILWNFQKDILATELLDYYGIPSHFVPDVLPVFSIHGELTSRAAKELGLNKGVPVSYKAGDQANNAFSLNVLEPGEIAATAGTSGVIYGVSNQRKHEEKSRVNTFLHINHTSNNSRYGVLLCINGTGILYSWLKNNFFNYVNNMDYLYMNKIAQKAPIGSNGLTVLPFGNGAERVLENKNIGCHFINLQFTTHTNAELLRAAQEGIAFSLKYGLEIMKKVGVQPDKIKAGFSNMFLSSIFCQAFATTTNTTLELYNTNGSCGAARAAGFGARIYKNIRDAFIGLKTVRVIAPEKKVAERYEEAYNLWLSHLNKLL